jgi:hypothetical protein
VKGTWKWLNTLTHINTLQRNGCIYGYMENRIVLVESGNFLSLWAMFVEQYSIHFSTHCVPNACYCRSTNRLRLVSQHSILSGFFEVGHIRFFYISTLPMDRVTTQPYTISSNVFQRASSIHHGERASNFSHLRAVELLGHIKRSMISSM